MGLLDAVARELAYFSDQEIFPVLAEGIGRNCNGAIPDLEQVASYATPSLTAASAGAEDGTPLPDANA